MPLHPSLQTNRSFLLTESLLRHLGYPQADLITRTLDPEVWGIDPYKLTDKNDPKFVLRKRVLRECERNIWYFFREVVRIPRAGQAPAPFMANAMSVAMIRAFELNQPFVAISGRQCGRSVTLQLLSLWCCLFPAAAEHPILLETNRKLATYTARGIKAFLDLLPPYMTTGGYFPTVRYIYPTLAENRAWLERQSSTAISCDDIQYIPELQHHMEDLVKKNEQNKDHLLNSTRRLRIHSGTQAPKGSPNHAYLRAMTASPHVFTWDKAFGTVDPVYFRFGSWSPFSLGYSAHWLQQRRDLYPMSEEDFVASYNLPDPDQT